MYRIRPILEQDFEDLVELAFQAQLGMTNLPKNPERLKQKLSQSLRAFSDTTLASMDHYYLFVLEEASSFKIAGVAGILAKSTLDEYLEYYQINERIPPPIFPEIPLSYHYLERVKYREKSTEICSLFVNSHVRKEGWGRLLSLSRFLFMAAFPERFPSPVFADIQGFIDSNGHSPFWDGLGRKFLPIDFIELMTRRDRGHTEISVVIPSSPIYFNLLNQETIKVIGETHPHALPALNMLVNQGFKKTGEIDLFDAGPRIAADLKEIKTIRERTVVRVGKIEISTHSLQALIANQRLDFRACVGTIEKIDQETVLLDQKTANALEVQLGDAIQYVAII